MKSYVVGALLAANAYFPFVCSSTQVSNNSHSEYTSSGSYIAANCVYQSLSTASSNGGAFFINSSSALLTVSFTAFFSCSSYGHGGAFYFVGSSANVSNSCGYECLSTNGWGQFFRTYTQSDLIVTHISACRCYNSTKCYVHSMNFYLGNQTIKYLNSTCNFVSLDSAGMDCRADINAVISNLNIYNNTCGSTKVIYTSLFTTTQISRSNIIGNIASANSSGILTACQYVSTVDDCIFYGNAGAPLLALENGGSLTVTGCFISHLGYSVATGGAQVQSCSYTVANTFAQRFILSKPCYIDPSNIFSLQDRRRAFTCPVFFVIMSILY